MSHEPGLPEPKYRWLLLVYKVPREPTALRATVWRKLKRLGAQLLHDAVWVLPLTDETREQMQWLAVEIEEMGGEAHVWEAQELLGGQEQRLVQQFLARSDAAYQELLDQLSEEEPDLLSLSRKYQQVQTQDYFHSSIGKRVRILLLERKGGKRR